MSQFPTWAAGQKILSASLLQMEPAVVIKPADTSRASVTGITADPDLFITNLAIGTYLLEGLIVYSGASIGTGDLKIAVSCTLGSVNSGSNWWGLVAPPTTGVNSLQGISNVFGTSFPYGSPGTSNNLNGVLRGVCQVATANSTIAIQWAQNTSTTTATVLRAGSWMSLKQVA